MSESSTHNGAETPEVYNGTSGRARVILKNSGALGVSTILGKLLYFLLFILIGRQLGPGQLGKFTFALSFVGMLSVMNDLGLNILAVRDVAREKNLAQTYLGNLIGLKAVLGLLALIITLGAAKLMGYTPGNIRMVLLLGLATLFITVSNGMRWTFQAFQRLEYESLIGVFQNFLCFALGSIAVLSGLGVYGVGYAQILVSMLVLAASWRLVTIRLIPVRMRIDVDFWKTTLRKSIPFALMLVFTGLYVNLDTVLLSRLKGDEVVGLYSAANRLVLAGKMIPAVILPALFPIMADASKGTLREFNRFVEKSSVLMFSLAFPLSVGTTILAPKVIGFFYGGAYAASVPCLQILIWGMFCMYLSIVFGYALISKGKQNANTLLTGLGLVLCLTLNLLLIPGWGSLGSGVAILATEALVMLGGAVFARKLLGFSLRPLVHPFTKVMLCTSVMAAGLYLTRELHPLVCVIVGLATYLIALFSLGGLCDYNLRRVRDVILARTT